MWEICRKEHNNTKTSYDDSWKTFFGQQKHYGTLSGTELSTLKLTLSYTNFDIHS